MPTQKFAAHAINTFPIDAQLLMLLPRAGASLRHPDARSPILRSDPAGYYLEQRIESDPAELSEVGLTRRIGLEDLSLTEWADFQQTLQAIDVDECRQAGVSQSLAQVQNRRWQRLLTGVMTFLNPRQVAIVVYLYRLAAQQQNHIVTLKSNELLQALGYTRTKDGGFAAKLRSQLHRDLVMLHRTELIYPVLHSKIRFTNAMLTGSKARAKAILQIQGCHLNSRKSFNLFQAADYTYELADRYTIALGFTDGLGRQGDCLWLPSHFDISQSIGSNAKNNYKTRLLIYLASRLKWETPSDAEYLILPKSYVFRNLDLFGSNGSRNNQIFWRTVESLKAAGYLISAQELPGKRKQNSIQFQINSEQLHSR
jgi:hypothetical protein